MTLRHSSQKCVCPNKFLFLLTEFKADNIVEALFSMPDLSVASEMPSETVKRTTSSCAWAVTVISDSAAVKRKCCILIIAGYFS